ncbi:cytochrome P450 [Virgibacillus sp. W0181]|uniref:cytochrome P450 n=1 Tax=Virgibacillus sp. W0181 TaxID=3391581 RepID=UPI003F45BD87
MSINYRIEIPRDKGIDCSPALMLEGYQFISNRRKKYRSNIFQTRLMGEKVICISGVEAAELLYDENKFKRNGAAPKRIQKTLFGQKGVQTLDDRLHKHRKHLFMSLMSEERLNTLTKMTEKQWESDTADWEYLKGIELYEEANKIMCQVACRWSGVPLQKEELNERTNDLAAMIDAFGAVGPRHWKGRSARSKTEKWIRTIIAQVRNGKLTPSDKTALYQMSWHRDLDNELMDVDIAAVELINILRPIVAIGRFITFGALALHTFPETQKKLQLDENNFDQMFVQEIRRYYPFTPFLGARVRKDFFWGGYDFKEGTLVLLDAYGMNHNPDLWESPEQFRPERFDDRTQNQFIFIPQGGGDYMGGHRCAGEWVTIEVMKKSLNFLVNKLDYEVPEQDLSYSMSRMPSINRISFIHIRSRSRATII